MVAEAFAVNIVIGGTPVRVVSRDSAFSRMIEAQYSGFTTAHVRDAIELEITLTEPAPTTNADDDLTVRNEAGLWVMQRGDLHAQYDPARRYCAVTQSANRYSIDSVIRIIHTLTLVTIANEGSGHDAAGQGFLLHAASAIRGRNAFVFTGVSGAGKTTIAGLAPPDVHLLSDEVSYIRRSGAGFVASGTPFTGELGRAGENITAPVKALYFLHQAPANRISKVTEAEAVRLLMRNILFFAGDRELVSRVFDAACEFIAAVPAVRLSFVPDERVWEEIV